MNTNNKVLESKTNENLVDIRFTEHALGIDDFNKPTVYYNQDAVAAKLIELLLLRPGSYPTRPYMGVGLVSRYRYTFLDNLDVLEDDISDQINTYLPELVGAKVSLGKDEDNKVLYISIVLDDLNYSLSLDLETKTLQFVTV